MASDYEAIRDKNKDEYGNIARWGPTVLTERYDDRTHFIFEILQNAEDALARRSSWTTSMACPSSSFRGRWRSPWGGTTRP